MSHRKRHGKSKNGSLGPVNETLPASELPDGVPAPAEPEPPGTRDPRGRLLPGNPLAARGGAEKARQARLKEALGIGGRELESPARAYLEGARAWRDGVLCDLAAEVGGGYVPPMAGAFVEDACRALAWSRWLSDQAFESNDDELMTKAHKAAETASKLVRDAWEYTAKQAKLRGTRPVTHDPLAAYTATYDDGEN